MSTKTENKQLQIIEEREVFKKKFRIYGDFENLLFLAKDIAEWIDYDKEKVGQMLNNIEDEEKITLPIHYSGQIRNMWFVTEDGLYEVLMQSRKPVAKEWKKKVKEILKEIRKTGKYENNSQYPQDYISALEEFVKLQKEKVEREKKLKEAEEKRDKMINYINFKFRFARTTYTTTEIAKTLGFSSAKQLGEILQEYGVLKRSFYIFTYTNGDIEEKSYLELTPKYLAKDYAVLDTKRNGAKVLRWKEAGIYFICDLLFNNQMLDYELKLIETKEEHYQKLLSQHTYKQEQISKYYKNKYGDDK
jgi:possible bacteriophage antirepressor